LTDEGVGEQLPGAFYGSLALRLMPIIFETSLQAQYILPTAISLGFGILFATAIILALVPCTYLILEDVRIRRVDSD
jgi:hypothetical protein